jgi:glycosyltransferase involved in cell wall biosynthesis
MIRVLQVIPSIETDRGGPARSTVSLCAALARQGAAVTLATCEGEGEVPAATGCGFETVYFPASRPRRLGGSRALVDYVRRSAGRFDLVHLHSLWNGVVGGAAAACRRGHVPYILTPRGMLSAWRGPWRPSAKGLYWLVRERRTVRAAARVHLLNGTEARASRRLLGHARTILEPNGVWCGEFEGVSGASFRRRWDLAGQPVVLFLGRLAPIKQLELQVDAFARLAESHPQLRWVFAGPDGGSLGGLRRRVQQAGLAGRVVFTGVLEGVQRAEALQAASVYCQSSRHEAHSMSITEALAAGRPCVLTRGCHFSEVARSGAGLEVPDDAAQIARAVESILSSPDRAVSMSQAARRLARAYDWDRIARRMIEHYRACLNGQERPEPQRSRAAAAPRAMRVGGQAISPAGPAVAVAEEQDR